MIKKSDIKNLTESQMISISELLMPDCVGEFSVSFNFTEEQEIYECLTPELEGGYHDGIVQFLFGDQYDGGEDGEYLIKCFDADFQEHSPSEEELKQIEEIIRNRDI